MLEFALFSVFVMVVGWYGYVDGATYIRPWLILLIGIFLACLAALMKVALTGVDGIPNLKAVFPHVNIAIGVVETVLAALGGGLISAAFILKMQIGYGKEKSRLKERESELLARISLRDDELKWLQKEAPSERTGERVQRIQIMLAKDNENLSKVQDKLRELDF